MTVNVKDLCYEGLDYWNGPDLASQETRSTTYDPEQGSAAVDRRLLQRYSTDIGLKRREPGPRQACERAAS